MARTATASEVAAQRRMYGWVRGQIFWSIEMAAFGHDLQNYATGRLMRLDDPTA